MGQRRGRSMTGRGRVRRRVAMKITACLHILPASFRLLDKREYRQMDLSLSRSLSRALSLFSLSPVSPRHAHDGIASLHSTYFKSPSNRRLPTVAAKEQGQRGRKKCLIGPAGRSSQCVMCFCSCVHVYLCWPIPQSQGAHADGWYATHPCWVVSTEPLTIQRNTQGIMPPRRPTKTSDGRCQSQAHGIRYFNSMRGLCGLVFVLHLQSVVGNQTHRHRHQHQHQGLSTATRRIAALALKSVNCPPNSSWIIAVPIVASRVPNRVSARRYEAIGRHM